MSTLLDRTSLPAWVFIIIIALGSLCIIATSAIIIRCCILRRNAKRNSVVDAGPMRRMTVRRGRMVPASNYLSLTGSRFGLNQFDEAETLRSRSKSPFEWWSSIKERKSHHDEMSYIESGRGRPRSAGDIFSRKDFAQSTSSLASDKQVMTNIQEVEPSMPSPTALPSPTSTRTNSFSRPFASRASSSPFVHSRGLSMIEEASPHNSIISVRSNTRRSGHLSGTNVVDGNLTRYEPRRPSSTSRTSSLSSPSTPSFRSISEVPEVPKPVAYRGSRSSLGEPEPRPSLSHRSSMSRHDSVTGVSRHSSKPPMPANDNTEEYWSSRPDLQPVQSNSKKGKVLRKKSLKRQEVYSMVAT
jgi:hypothetical protein